VHRQLTVRSFGRECLFTRGADVITFVLHSRATTTQSAND
jgi:hypothetical protein